MGIRGNRDTTPEPADIVLGIKTGYGKSLIARIPGGFENGAKGGITAHVSDSRR